MKPEMNEDCLALRAILDGLPEDQTWPADIRARVNDHIKACELCWPSLMVLAKANDAISSPPIHRDLATVDCDRMLERIQRSVAEARGGRLGTRGDGPRKLRMRVFAAASLAAAALIAIVTWLIAAASPPTAVLNRLTIQEPGMGRYEFPDRQAEFLRDTTIGLEADSAPNRYVLFFADDGAVRTQKLEPNQESIDWQLSGEGMSSAILLASGKPLENIDGVAQELAGVVARAELEPGTQLIWTDEGPKVEVFKTMGEPAPSDTPPEWTQAVRRILNRLEGVSIHGYSLRVEGGDE